MFPVYNIPYKHLCEMIQIFTSCLQQFSMKSDLKVIYLKQIYTVVCPSNKVSYRKFSQVTHIRKVHHSKHKSYNCLQELAMKKVNSVHQTRIIKHIQPITINTKPYTDLAWSNICSSLTQSSKVIMLSHSEILYHIWPRI